MLDGIEEVDIERRGDLIVITPVGEEDPIFRIGRNPVKDTITDASVNHDKYIYTGK